jgi:hypothetical protein
VNVWSAIVNVPMRLAPDRLVATMNVTLPLPFPGPALRTAIQAALLSAPHAHACGAVTTLLPDPPSAVNHRLVGTIEKEQALGAFCVTVKVLPAIVSVPVRGAVTVFAATVNVTLPEPDPVAPPVTLIHAALLLAVHEQPDPAVTTLLPDPPSLANVCVVGDALYEQLAPACVTVNVAPAIESVPLRLVVEVFAATENPAVPVPDPDAPLVTVIHAALLVALQAQPEPAVTVVLPEPPAAANDWLFDAML